MSEVIDVKIVEENIDIDLIANVIVSQILNQSVNVKNESQEVKAEIKVDEIKVQLDKSLVYFVEPNCFGTVKEKSLYWWGAVQSVSDLKNIDTGNENYNTTGGLVLVLDRLTLYRFVVDTPTQQFDDHHIVISNFAGYFELFTAQIPRLTTSEMLAYTPYNNEEVFNKNLQKTFRFIKQRWRES